MLGNDDVVGPLVARPIDYRRIVTDGGKLFADLDNLAFAVILIHHDLDDVKVVDSVEVAVDSVDNHKKGTDKDHTGDKHEDRRRGHNAVTRDALEALT